MITARTGLSLNLFIYVCGLIGAFMLSHTSGLNLIIAALFLIAVLFAFMSILKLNDASASKWLSAAIFVGFIASAVFGEFVQWAINAIRTSRYNNPNFQFVGQEAPDLFIFPTWPIALQAGLFIPALYEVFKPRQDVAQAFV